MSSYIYSENLLINFIGLNWDLGNDIAIDYQSVLPIVAMIACRITNRVLLH